MANRGLSRLRSQESLELAEHVQVAVYFRIARPDRPVIARSRIHWRKIALVGLDDRCAFRLGLAQFLANQPRQIDGLSDGGYAGEHLYRGIAEHDERLPHQCPFQADGSLY